MAIPDITSLSSNPPTTQLHTLQIGELLIEGRSYTVTVESSDPLISSPHDDTIQKIEDLVNVYLNNLRLEKVDLSKIVIEQLDEEGLSYVNSLEDNQLESNRLSPSQLQASISDLPQSLCHPSITSISDVYRFIIDSLVDKKSEKKDEGTTPPIDKKKFIKRINFTPKLKEPLVNTEKNPSDPKPSGSPAKDWTFWGILSDFFSSGINRKKGYEKMVDTDEITSNDQDSYLQNSKVKEDIKKFGNATFA